MDLSQEEGIRPFVKNHLLIIITTFAVTSLFASTAFLAYYRYNHKRIRRLERTIAEAQTEKKAILGVYCKGTWKDGNCIKNSCIDSDANEKPEDIYIKGSVIYTDVTGKEVTKYDECTGSNEQVNEMWCYENPAGSGNFVYGQIIYDCDNDCDQGACIRAVKTDEDKMREVLGARHKKPTSDAMLEVINKTSTHAFGTVSFTGEPTTNWWLGVKEGETWNIVAEGNGAILCSSVEPYDFPSSVVEDCYDEVEGKTITR